MSADAIQGDFGQKSSNSSVNYGHKFTQNNDQINIFGGNNDGNYLNKVLERNGGIVPVASGAIRY